MQIITRNEKEGIVINGNIRVINFGLNQYHQIKIGIDAPKEIKIIRKELTGRIKNE